MGETWAHDLQICVLPQDAGLTQGGELAGFDAIRPDSWCAQGLPHPGLPPAYICGQLPLFEHLIRPPPPGT